MISLLGRRVPTNCYLPCHRNVCPAICNDNEVVWTMKSNANCTRLELPINLPVLSFSNDIMLRQAG